MANLHTVLPNDTTQNVVSMSGRPEWAKPKEDREGNITGWFADPALLRNQILKDHTIVSLKKRDGNYDEYLYNGEYWEPLTQKGIQKIVGEYFIDDPEIGYRVSDLENVRVTAGTIYLLHNAIATDTYENTFDVPEGTPGHEYDLNYTPFMDYDYDILTGQKVNKSPERYFLYTRDYNLDWDGVKGPARTTNEWLLRSLGGDKEELQLLKIFIGACFYRSYKPLQFMVFIKGEGEDGKSVFLDYLSQHLIGRDMSAGLSFDQITRTGTNFALSELYHKELNTYDDINGSFIDSAMMGTIKQLTGGNVFDAEVKNKGNLRFANYAKMIFGVNTMPEIQNLGYAEKRRIYIFKWHKIPEAEKYYPKADIIKERGQFAKECIDAFSIVLLQRQLGKSQADVLPRPKDIELNWQQFEQDSDPVARYIAHRCEIDKETTVPKTALFENFEKWAEKHKLKSKDMTDRKFNKRMKALGYTESVQRINGEPKRVWNGLRLLPFEEENEID